MRNHSHEAVRGMTHVGRILAVAGLLAVGAPPTGLHAQTILGQVLESGSTSPVPWASLALLDTTGVEVTQTLGDSTGRFRLVAPEPGSYLVRVQRIGYRGIVDGIIDLGEGGRLTVNVYLRPVPLELEGITARAEYAIRYLEREGFYERMRGGIGAFMTPEDIADAGAVYDLPSLIQRVPFVQRLDRFGLGPTVQMMGRGGRCIPSIYVDNVEMQPGTNWDGYVAPEELLAVEVFRGAAQIPSHYGGMFEQCGLVLIWTTRGQRASGP